MTNRPSDTDLRHMEDALRLAVDYGRWDGKLTSQIRSMVGETAAAIVMATADLQTKARAKLGDGLWWCTERSLSQSTPHPVAALKARWLDSPSVFDLCCGIGGDTLALASTIRTHDQKITAIDRDPAIAAMATENLRLNLKPNASEVAVVCSNVTDVSIPDTSALHIDPDRRDDSGRKVRPQDYSPTWDVVEQLIDRVSAAIIKLAPAADLGDHPGRHRTWISLGGSVREQSLLTGASIQRAGVDLHEDLAEGGRSAIVAAADGSAFVFAHSNRTPWTERAEKASQFMVDPDPAIRAAGLTASFAEENGLQVLGSPSGFLTGKTATPPNLAICERVIWAGSCDDRKLRQNASIDEQLSQASENTRCRAKPQRPGKTISPVRRTTPHPVDRPGDTPPIRRFHRARRRLRTFPVIF